MAEAVADPEEIEEEMRYLLSAVCLQLRYQLLGRGDVDTLISDVAWLPTEPAGLCPRYLLRWHFKPSDVETLLSVALRYLYG
jgi:hypothetical protein